MANRYLKQTTIYTEGKNDLHTIANLLEQHKFQMASSPKDVEIKEAARDGQASGRQELLKIVTPAVKASTDKAIGFVIDADESTAFTWDAVRHRVEEAILAVSGKSKLPKAFPNTGFVTNIPELRSRIGVLEFPTNGWRGILRRTRGVL